MTENYRKYALILFKRKRLGRSFSVHSLQAALELLSFITTGILLSNILLKE